VAGLKAEGTGPTNGRPGGRIAALLLMLLAACALTDPKVRTRAVDVEIRPGANNDNAVEVDVVLAYDRELVQQLADLSAADWFRRRSEMTLAFPAGAYVKSFEVVPGQPALHWTVPEQGSEAVGAFIFAGYATEGLHRARVDALEAFAIVLDAKKFSIEPRS
jgi:type VI secretion system protein